MRAHTLLTAAAIALSAPLAACASSGPTLYHAPGYGAAAPTGYAPGAYAPARTDDGLLAEPPADARAGQCFAKVVVPGQPIYGPPAGPHLKWVQNPAPPGAIGPVWCQVWEQGYQPTVTYTPERFGWIRVICDKDATRDKISHIQHRLHDWGDYQGGYGGDFDTATADAVKRFQSERHIEHGGYLSFKTMEMLDGAPPVIAPPPATYAQSYAPPQYAQPQYAQPQYAPPVVAPPVYQAPVYQAPIYQAPVYPAPVYQPPVYQPPVYQPPVYAQQQPCAVACQPVAPPCGPAPCQGGYAPQGYGAQTAGYGSRRWLTWSSKVTY